MNSNLNRRRSPKSLLGIFLKFLRSPDLEAPSGSFTPRESLIQILRLYSLEYTTVISVLFLLDVLNAPSGEQIENYFETPAISLFISAIVLAPLIEETIFRLPLRPFILNITVFSSLIVYLVSLWTQPYNFIQNGVLLILLNVIVGSRCSNTKMLQRFYRRYSRFIFYSFTLLFGALHIMNYEPESWKLLPLLVFSQTLGGLLLGFVRIHYGFGWAIFLHAFHNSLACLPILIFKAFGSLELQRHVLSDKEDAALSFSDLLIWNAIAVFEWGVVALCSIVTWTLIREWYKLDKVPASRKNKC